MTITLAVRGDYIQLDQALKATGLCSSGGVAHIEIEAGKVSVDGVTETRKRAKLHPGQRISYAEQIIELVGESSS